MRQAVASGDRSRLSSTIYKALAKELWVLGQLLLGGNRTIMPESLWKHTIALAHEGHQGPRSKTKPIRSTTLPEVPWGDIAVDLLEIRDGNHLLTVVENYSRWPAVIFLKKTDASHVTRAMKGSQAL